jgi:hypothetical protein
VGLPQLENPELSGQVWQARSRAARRLLVIALNAELSEMEKPKKKHKEKQKQQVSTLVLEPH